ncbi:MAG: hypothetical protein F4052_08660 [Dehalococcoidia bacterium]|nr:hypothetical protein [Dehalococcoidia bacterium]MYK26995.1 hypothetical protein [Dehalococcoidia bacterium]
MDPTALIPGLAQMLEERYGWAGRWATHVLLFSAVALVAFTALGMAILVVGQIVTFEPFPFPPTDDFGRIGTYVLAWIVIIILLSTLGVRVFERWVFPRVTSKLERINNDIERTKEGIREERALLAEAMKDAEAVNARLLEDEKRSEMRITDFHRQMDELSERAGRMVDAAESGLSSSERPPK